MCTMRIELASTQKEFFIYAAGEHELFPLSFEYAKMCLRDTQIKTVRLQGDYTRRLNTPKDFDVAIVVGFH